MAAQFNGRNGTEAPLCEVIVVLNIAAFRHQWAVRGEGFRSKYTICYLEMAEEFARCWGALFACFTSFVCPIARLQLSIGKLKIVVTVSFFNASRWGLKKNPNKVLTVRFCSKLSSVKCSARTRESFEGVKHSLFISISHSLLRFGSWVILKVQTLDFGFPLKFTMNLKPKQFQISRISWARQQGRQKCYFRQFSRSRYDYEG